MKTSRIIIRLLCILVVFQACAKKIECPEFKDFELIPELYNINQTLVFEDNQNNKNEINIIEVVHSESYDYKCKDLNRICFCESYAEIRAKHIGSGNEFTLLRIETNDRNGNLIYRFHIRDFNFEFEFDFENDAPLIDLFENIEFVGNFQQFTGVFVITNTDEESISNLHQVYFNQEFGILRLVDKNTNKNWDLKI